MALQRANVEEIYKKHKEIKKEDVQMILEWLKKEPHLPKLSELEVTFFLQSCDFNVEKSKKIIDLHYTCRTHAPELYSNRVISEHLREQMDVFCVNFLPGLTPDGKSILFFKLMDTNLDKLNHEDQMKIFMMVLDLHLMRNGPSINVGIADMDGMTLAHMMKMNLSLSRKCHFLTEEAPILKVKGFHHINSVSFVDKIMSYLKKVAYTKEFFDMVYFYPPGEMEKLFEHIPKSMMPKNYGGDGPSIEELHSMMKKDLIENADYFNEEEMTRRVNEELRPGGPKTAMDLFGLLDSFKDLKFD